jgi:undecaprenyl pyrophosphate phosphatase UppP
LQHHSTWIFVAYRLVFGLVILLFFRASETPLG